MRGREVMQNVLKGCGLQIIACGDAVLFVSEICRTFFTQTALWGSEKLSLLPFKE